MRQSIVFVTNPEGASVEINGKQMGVTPCRLDVKKRHREPELVIKKEGYVPVRYIMETKIQPITFLNTINIYGFLIDYLTGATSYYVDNEYARNLLPVEGSKLRERFLIINRVKSFGDITIDADMMEWGREGKLKLENFKAFAPTFSKAVATTTSNFSCYYIINDTAVKFYISSRFYKDLSWFKSPDLEENKIIYKPYLFAKPENTLNYVLNHEQRHFDITELYSRMFKERIKKHKFKKETFEQELSSLFNKTYTEWVKTQNEYDKNCGHGIRQSNQDKWSKWVDNQLVNYEAYKDPVLNLSIN